MVVTKSAVMGKSEESGIVFKKRGKENICNELDSRVGEKWMGRRQELESVCIV